MKRGNICVFEADDLMLEPVARPTRSTLQQAEPEGDEADVAPDKVAPKRICRIVGTLMSHGIIDNVETRVKHHRQL